MEPVVGLARCSLGARRSSRGASRRSVRRRGRSGTRRRWPTSARRARAPAPPSSSKSGSSKATWREPCRPSRGPTPACSRPSASSAASSTAPTLAKLTNASSARSLVPKLCSFLARGVTHHPCGLIVPGPPKLSFFPGSEILCR